MYNFKFYAPTKVVFGRNTEEQLTDLVREFGGKKPRIHDKGIRTKRMVCAIASHHL